MGHKWRRRVRLPALAIVVDRLRMAFLAIILVTTFVTICVAGPLGVYLALAAVLASMVLAFDPYYLRVALRDWGVRGFLVSFFMLSFAFCLTAQDSNDVLAVFDFLALPIIVPAFALMARVAAPSRITIVASLATLGATVALLNGLYEVKVLGIARAAGGTSPVFFSGMAVLLGFFCLLGVLSSASRWRWIFLVGHLFAAGAAMLGGTRGALLGYVASLFIAIIVLFFRQGPLKARSLIIALAITIIAVCSASLFDTARFGSIATIINEAATGGTVSDASTNQRLAIYQGGVGSFLASPIYGHGWWRRFEAAIPYMPEVGRAAMAHDNHAHLHNEILNFGSAAGIIGIIAYLILMAAPLVSAIRSPRTANWPIRITAAVGLVACYMAMGLVDTMFVFEIPKSMYVLCSAVIMAFFLDEPPQPRASAKVTAN
jgi:O-antigen ligase